MPKAKPQQEPDFQTATADEMWEWCMLEYENPNPITQHLIEGFYKQLAQVLAAQDPIQSFFEVGCGVGQSTRRIHAMLKPGQTLTASDYDSRYVEKLNSLNFPVSISQESVYSLSHSDSSVDCLIMLEVLEHLDDVDQALKELTRVARRYVVVSVPHEPIWCCLNFMRGRYWKDRGNTPGHINHWNKTRFRNLLSGYGQVKMLVSPLPWLMAMIEV